MTADLHLIAAKFERYARATREALAALEASDPGRAGGILQSVGAGDL